MLNKNVRCCLRYVCAVGGVVFFPTQAQAKTLHHNLEVESTVTRHSQIELGAAGGLGIPHNGLGLGPSVALEINWARALGTGVLAVGLRGGYGYHRASSTAKNPCQEQPPPFGPCVDANGGDVPWTLGLHAGTVDVPVGYRFFPQEKRWHPYFTIAPGISIAKVESRSFDLKHEQHHLHFWVMGALGVQVRLGPGGMFFEGAYGYSPFNTDLTGSGHLGTILLRLGYRWGL